MKKSRLFILHAGLIIGLLALYWSRAQTPSHPLKVMVNGVEVHTLMLDQHNALVGYLETAGQTNALELFRQYRCSYRADLSSSELGETVAILQYLRKGDTNQAIRLLEERLGRNANLLLNSYGGLNPTNRERVNLEPLQQAREYFTMFPSPVWGQEMDKDANEVLSFSERPRK